MTLSADDFPAFFTEMYGYPPFPWQTRLLGHLVRNNGVWPDVLDLPTGSGKTAAMDIALFHLALEAGKKADRKAPVRIAFVVDRRLIVNDAHNRARNLADALKTSTGPVTQKVAVRLKQLSGNDDPLIARQLRGGIPREDDWARTPCQPTILCSTVDQVGSRLLFRGYGVSDTMKPVHAGLLGTDCLILLDEAHLAEPFRQTLKAIELYTSDHWRQAGIKLPSFRTALLTATPGETTTTPFALAAEDDRDETLTRRRSAAKPAHLVLAGKVKADADEDTANSDDDLKSRLNTLSDLTDQALKSARAPAIAVVVNRIKRARALFRRLNEQYAGTKVGLELIIGPARPVDRDVLTKTLDPIRTGHRDRPDTPMIVVATQTIEAGVDIDFDALITEAAPVDALRQRFGRLNRAGRDIAPFAAIVAVKSDVSSRADDPVYGRATVEAWKWLTDVKQDAATIDFGIDGFKAYGPPPVEACTDKPNAPVLMPAHVDLFSQTYPIPACDPEVGLYLHGPGRQSASVTVVWRADIAQDDQDTHHLMTLMPPRSGETIELPVGAVKGWLTRAASAYADLADVATRDDDDDNPRRGKGMVYRFHRDADRSGWIWPQAIRPGDTLIVPCILGGVDRYGFDPDHEDVASDVADRAAEAYAGKRFAVRVAPGLLENEDFSALSDALAGAVSEKWMDLKDALLDLSLPAAIRARLNMLPDARSAIQVSTSVYGQNDGKPRGVVFLAPRGLHRWPGEEALAVTEDDTSGTLMGFAQSLEAHSNDVKQQAALYAETLGSQQAADVTLAAWLHDTGKADPRFQAWLNYGDPLGFGSGGQILAKSGRSLPAKAQSRTLPDQWRHEAQSVRIALQHTDFEKAVDRELVLWLIGTHHGRGRPFFPHADVETPILPEVMGIPRHLSVEPGPQSLAFDYNGHDWASLFAGLKARYGAWGLAWLEAIVRLADHRASEAAQEGTSA